MAERNVIPAQAGKREKAKQGGASRRGVESCVFCPCQLVLFAPFRVPFGSIRLLCVCLLAGPVQNKANLARPLLTLTVVQENAYERNRRTMPL
jgi:hypothetical protein